MTKQTVGTVTLSLIDDKSMMPETLEALRMQVEQVLVSEHVKRLLRQLQGATGLRWEASQTPRPKGTQQPTHKEIQAAHAKQKAETEAYFEARRQLRAAGIQAREAAIERLRAQGVTSPTAVQISDELRNKPAAVSETAGRKGDPLSTDATVRRILAAKATD